MAIRQQSTTCIAALQTKSGRILMAGDRRVSWDFGQYQKSARPKIAVNGDIIMGATGTMNFCTMFVHNLKLPKFNNNDVDEYIYEDVYDAIFNRLSKKGFTEEHNLLKIPEGYSCELIIGIQNRLFSLIIDKPEQYNENPNGIIDLSELSLPYATGCGGALAWGSLLTSEGDTLDSIKYKLAKNFNIHKYPIGVKKLEEFRLYYSICVAAQVSPGCDDEIDIIST